MYRERIKCLEEKNLNFFLKFCYVKEMCIEIRIEIVVEM